MSKTVRILSLILAFASLLKAADPDKIIRVGYQKGGALYLVRFHGALEAKFAPLGYSVEWHEFSSGPPLLEALNAASLDFGHSGDAPLVLAQSSGVAFRYIGQTYASPKGTAILVPYGSTLQTLTDLKGKRVAFAKGSSAHYVVARALLKAGLTFHDITPVYLSPSDARAAFEAGAVDAWAIWDPYYAAAEVDAKARVLVNGEGLQSHREFYFGRTAFLDSHPELVAPFLDVLRESGAEALADPKGTAAFLAPKLRLSLEVVERSEFRQKRYGASPLDATGIGEQQELADTFLRLGLIPSPIVVRDFVYQPPSAR